ncbi:MAG: AhpC/TSA family protein [Balneolaceae bacterium]|nr:MAG: AhpC/TSA family protein [Balneolaceae bacterium]
MTYLLTKPYLFLSAVILSLLAVNCTNNEQLVPDSASEVSPLLIGSTIPDISLLNPQEEAVNLNEISSQQTLYVFYRGGWCPFCSGELSDLSEIENELQSKGIEIVAISPDTPEYLKHSLEDTEPGYTLLSDSGMEAAKAFGVAFRVDQETVQSLKEGGMDIEERSGQGHHMLPVPSVFLTNSEGKIVFQYVNPDYRQRVDKSVIMAAVNSILEE